MSTTRPLSEILPPEMKALNVRTLFTLLLDVAPAINVGKTPGVDRRVGVITGGRFEGERLREQRPHPQLCHFRRQNFRQRTRG